MTAIEQAIQKRGLSVYKLMQLMGKNPRSYHGTFVKKLRGKTPIPREELTLICNTINEHTGDFLTEEEVDVEPTMFILR